MSTITLTLTATAVTVSATPSTVTASVTNASTVPARVVLGSYPPLAGGTGAASASGWTAVDRPLREIAAGATEQYTVTVIPPDGAAAGEYAVRLIAYDADRPPEEYSDQAQQVTVTVPSQPVAPAAGVPWWIYLVAGVLVLIVGVVAFYLLRPGEPEPSPSPTVSSTPTPTPSPTLANPCPSPFVPRLANPTDLTCVMPASAEEARWDNRADVQRGRIQPDTDPPQCRSPYVTRAAFADDTACTWEETANRTHIENQPGYTEHQFNDKEYPETFFPRR